jgi:hypothetical protein
MYTYIQGTFYGDITPIQPTIQFLGNQLDVCPDAQMGGYIQLYNYIYIHIYIYDPFALY